LHQAKADIEARTDMIHIVKKLMEVDMLKTILLNSDQKIIFDNLEKPKMKFVHSHKQTKKGQKPDIDSEDWFSKSELTDEEVKSIYSKLTKKQNRSEIDEKLIFLFKSQEDRKENNNYQKE
jgi:hypothetical protein